jgi:hypothetical protein
MADEINQSEANALLAMDKQRLTEEIHSLPGLGGRLSVELTSLDRRERFILDVNRSHISLTKVTYQTRARVTAILARLDLDGAPHRNPDDTEIPCPHLHLYREGFGDKWAFPLPDDFGNPTDRWRTLSDFMAYCRIIEPPILERGLFW